MVGLARSCTWEKSWYWEYRHRPRDERAARQKTDVGRIARPPPFCYWGLPSIHVPYVPYGVDRGIRYRDRLGHMDVPGLSRRSVSHAILPTGNVGAPSSNLLVANLRTFRASYSPRSPSLEKGDQRLNRTSITIVVHVGARSVQRHHPETSSAQWGAS